MLEPWREHSSVRWTRTTPTLCPSTPLTLQRHAPTIIAVALRKYCRTLYKCAKWAHQAPADLVAGEFILESGQGARQGNLLGPILFSLDLRPFLEALQAYLGPGRKVVAYPDNMYILSTDERALHDTKVFLKDWTDTLRLNSKSASRSAWRQLRRMDSSS